ncbi:MAG: HD domain-containing protein [Deltaproteobacteria bacterium]|nr:HD domain-containing protein [Deltaproteobacteria bacterium]
MLITAHDSPPSLRAEGLAAGAMDFISRPIDNEELAARVKVMLRISETEKRLVSMNQELEGMVADRTRKLRRSLENLRTTMKGTITVLGRTVEWRDPYTAGHQRRVAELVQKISNLMGLDKDRVEGAYTAALVHDLGKIAVPAEILAKPTRLTKAEFELIKGHSTVGFDILKDIKFPWPVATMIRQHHERMDGSGYPDGAKGDKILLEARVIGVADVVEAISAHRPYRPALGLDVAVDEIRKNRDRLYDPNVVDSLLKLIDDGWKFDREAGDDAARGSLTQTQPTAS